MAIENIMALGITKKVATFALKKHKWDVERSTDWIFEQGDALNYLNEPDPEPVVTPTKKEVPVVTVQTTEKDSVATIPHVFPEVQISSDSRSLSFFFLILIIHSHLFRKSIQFKNQANTI